MDIIVFGAGRYYSKKKESVKEKYRVKAFIDNMLLPGQVSDKDGTPMYSPHDLQKIDSTTAILLMSAEWFDMWKQLINLGIDERRIIFGTIIPPFYDNVEEAFHDEGVQIYSSNAAVYFEKHNDTTIIKCNEDIEEYIRRLFARGDPYIKMISEMPIFPSSRRFGAERGHVIDRLYIEDFLKKNVSAIKGTVMEIGDSRYMTMFADNIEEAVVLHVNGWGGIKGNLATGEGIEENSVDCLICTQTIQHIFDVQTSIENIYRLLKPGGTALVTNGCIAQLSLYDYHNWGEYWKFTDMAAKAMFAKVFDKDKIVVETYGNMKAAIAFLYGMCSEEVPAADLFMRDEQFPMIVTIKARK